MSRWGAPRPGGALCSGRSPRHAIQQMARLRRYSRLDIVLSYQAGTPQPVHVRFVDQGPGIHYQQWERIFEFGFTTRRGGAGLGLTISRQIASELGGTLRVEKSHMLWGTTFLLTLPRGDQND